MKLIAFIMAIAGAFMMYLGVSGKTITFNGHTYGGGSGGGKGASRSW